MDKEYNRFQKLLRKLRRKVLYKQCKILKDHMVRFKIISLYIYKDLRLKTYEIISKDSHDHHREDGNLVPSPRRGFCFEAAFQL